MKPRVTLILLLVMIFVGEILAEEITLPSNLPKAGKVAFLWEGEDNASEAEKRAKDFFVAYTGGKGAVITSEDQISKEQYDCIWIHIARQIGGFPHPNFPSSFTQVNKNLEDYLKEGGNLYLSGHATYLTVLIGRTKLTPNTVGKSARNRPIDRYINTLFKSKQGDIVLSNHPIYEGLKMETDKEYLYPIYRVNQGYITNAFWDLYIKDLWSPNGYSCDNITDFEKETNSTVIGNSLDDHGNNEAGIVEFPKAIIDEIEYKGKIIANGMAGACEWEIIEDDPNEYQDNLYRLTANILSYLCPAQASEEVMVEGLNLQDNKFAVEFQVSDDDIVIPLAISFNQEINPSDFEVTVKPYDNAKNWKTLSDTDNIEEAYRAALNHSALFDEYRAMGGEKAKIDGFYNGAENFTGSLVKATDHEGYNYVSYDIRIPGIPCSGRYMLSITPSADLNLNDADNNLSNIPLDIYPNLFGEFGTAGIKYTYTDASGETQTLTSGTNKGFNINGYTFDTPDIDFAIINIPPNFENLANAVGYIPGIYFASELVHDTGASSAPSRQEKRVAASVAEGDTHPYFIPIDLTEITNSGTGQVDLKIKVTKNDASKTFNFSVKTDDQNVNTSTIVNEIFSVNDHSQPIFYNLQGIQVKSPRKGIFIKVEGGKSTKVVF